MRPSKLLDDWFKSREDWFWDYFWESNLVDGCVDTYGMTLLDAFEDGFELATKAKGQPVQRCFFSGVYVFFIGSEPEVFSKLQIFYDFVNKMAVDTNLIKESESCPKAPK